QFQRVRLAEEVVRKLRLRDVRGHAAQDARVARMRREQPRELAQANLPLAVQAHPQLMVRLDELLAGEAGTWTGDRAVQAGLEGQELAGEHAAGRASGFVVVASDVGRELEARPGIDAAILGVDLESRPAPRSRLARGRAAHATDRPLST